MTYKRRICGIILCVVLLAFVSTWVVAGNNTSVDLPIPVGHYVEKDTSRIKLLNVMRSIVQARTAIVENLANAQTAGHKRLLVRFIDSSTVVLSRDLSQGESVRTSRSLDITILGKGYIAVTDPRGERLYTRCGTLMLNAEGTLTYVNGYALAPAMTVPSDYAHVSIQDDGSVSCLDSNGTASVIGCIQLSVFPDAESLHRKGQGLYKESAASGMPMTGTPGSNGFGEIKAGFVESSNVNEKEEIRILEELEEYESHVQKALDIVRLH